jgi:hypothetical protein
LKKIEPLTDGEIDEIERTTRSPLIRRFIATVRDLQQQIRENDELLDAIEAELQ